MESTTVTAQADQLSMTNRPVMRQSCEVKTRILILSDTHGKEFPQRCKPQMPVDVAIHCGDLTEESKLAEYQTTLELLREIDASLKLVIAGNHDFTLDTPAFRRILSESQLGTPTEDEDVKRDFGDFGEARAVLEGEANSKIVFLDEGSHRFTLANGAEMTVFASPMTPSKTIGWGFQYVPSAQSLGSTTPDQQPPSYFDGHTWSIKKDTHLVITHGPPRGILDRNDDDKTRTGSEGLFAAVARAKPRLHCFGHIHEGWGAKLVTWRDMAAANDDHHQDGPVSHFTHIDNAESRTIECLASLSSGKFDTPEVSEEKRNKLETHRRARACVTSHSRETGDPLHAGQQTLFVNAAVQGKRKEEDDEDGEELQLPWIAEIDLPRAARV